jgi:hypothetical protein
MARKHDKGAYEPGNVKCVTSGSNHSEFNVRRGTFKHNRAFLERDEVVAIYKSKLKYSVIAKRHEINTGVIQRIKNRRSFAHFTEHLETPGKHPRNPR